MDLPSGFNVENWESEGNFEAPGNENVSLVLTEDVTTKFKAELPQAEVISPSEQSSSVHEHQSLELETSVNIPVAEELVAGDGVLVESNLEVPVAQDSVDLYEQQFMEQHVIKSPQQIEINDIPLPNETGLVTQSLIQTDKNEGLNQSVKETAQAENSQPAYTECLKALPFPQENSSIVIDGGNPASVQESDVTTFNKATTSTTTATTSETEVPVQENVVINFVKANQIVSGEYILPDHELATEEELSENVVGDMEIVEITQPTKVEMTEISKREPEDLLADLNTSGENTETQSLDESAIEYNNNAEITLADVDSETAANGKSVIDLVLPIVDAESVTMTDPVTLRPAKPSTTRKSAQTSSTVDEDAVTYYTQTLPAHVIGRPSENPLEEQKLRPGLKSPMGYLRSQILSKTELAEELQQRTKKKNPSYNYPVKGDIFFAKTLTKRLASHIKGGEVIAAAANESKASNAKLAPLPPTLSEFKESKAKKAAPPPKPVVVDDAKRDDTDLLAILEGEVDDWTIDRPPPQLIEAASSPINIQQHPPTLDPSVEDLDLETQPPKLQVEKKEFAQKKLPPKLGPSVEKESPQTKPAPKLDPSVEKELALQQLSNMPVRARRPQSAKQPPRKSTVEVRRLAAGGSADAGDRPLRKRKVEVPAVPVPKKALPHSNGAASPVVNAERSGAKVTALETEAKQPRIFKTKRAAASSALTNGTASVAAPTEESVAAETTASKPAEAVDVPALVTRELVSPPRTYSARIKKSTFSDDFVFPSTSKSRAVPIVGAAKPTKKPAKPAAAKAETAPPETTTPVATTAPAANKKLPAKTTPKAPPKKAKPAEPTPASTSESAAKSPATKSPKKVPKKLSEIDRLLMDEGAINMLYAVEQNEEKRRSGGGSSEEPPARKRLVKTTRHSAKELLMKTRLVKSAVQRLRNTTDPSAVSLRTKRANVATTPATPAQARKASFDSNVSMQSPPPLTPADPGSPTQVFSYPPRLRPPAEASRIIRRHSSSSNFSSRSASPTASRRLSVDVTSPDAEEAPVARETRKRGGSLYITKLQNASGAKKKKIAARTASVEDAIFQPNVKAEELLSPSNKTKLQNQMAKNFQKSVKGKAAAAVKKTMSTDSTASSAKGKAPDLTACLAEAVTAFIAEDGNVDSSNVPPGLSTDSCLIPPVSPSSSFSYSSLIKTLEADCQRRADDSAKERTSPRQSVGLGSYKELSIRRHDNMVQVILAPVSTKMMDSLNPQVLKELQDVLTHLQKDDSCRAVLLTSTGSAFCLGLDFHSLIEEKADKRRAVAQQFALTLKHFMTSLSQFTKPIIAGVHGAAVGLGVTMLPFFDMVFASDKATFYTPYAKLGQVPEGAAVVALPQLLGNAVTSELLYACRKLTASEALQYGLVTRILWPDRFHEELLPLINSLAAQSAQSMEATKALLRYNLRARVDAALESEAQLLVQHWSSAECQANFKRFLDDEDIGLQRQRSADV